MVSFFRTYFWDPTRRVRVTLLAFALFFGFTLGAYIAAISDLSYVPLMRAAASGGVSISCLFSAMLLPFLFTAFVVYIRQYWLLIPVALSKAFSFSYLGCYVLSGYGESGWLIQLLLMFADCLIMPVLVWLWLSILDRYHRLSHLFCGAGAALIGIVFLDFQFISPFLVNLLS